MLQRATGKLASSIFIFNFAVANFTMASELERMVANISWEMVVISVSWKEFQKIDGKCRQHTHDPLHVQRSAVCSQARNASHALGSKAVKARHCHFCAPEKNLSSVVAHVSPFVVLAPAVYHEHITFLIHFCFYHTRTRSTIGSI